MNVVRPGGEILLRVRQRPKIERMLQVVDAIAADPADIAPEYWRHLHKLRRCPQVLSRRTATKPIGKPTPTRIVGLRRNSSLVRTLPA